MATPATLKKIDDKKMAAQQRREKLEADQLLPLTGMSNAPSAHLLVSSNPNPAPRMMDIRPLGPKNPAQFTQYRQQMGMYGAGYEDFASDQPHPATQGNQNYMSFAAYDQRQQQQQSHQQQQQYSSSQAQNHPEMMNNISATFSQIQVGPMPMRPLSAWNAHTKAISKVVKGATGGGMGGGGGGGRVFGHRPEGPVGPPKLRPQTVETAPPNVDSVEYTVRSNNLVCFHGKSHFLSTLYPVNIYIDGHAYPSVEHYYQACKIFSLAGPEQAQMLRLVPDPLQAKSRARDVLRACGMPNKDVRVEKWKNSHGLVVLLHGIRHKFNQDSELRDKLLNTGDALLCQAYDRDSMFAVGMNEPQMREWVKENEGMVLKLPAELTDEKVKYLPMMGKGKNVLGVLCMQVRKMIRDCEAENPPSVEQQENDGEEEEENVNEEVEEKSTQSESDGEH